MNRTMIYFSGTGNSRYIANRFCHRMKEDHDIIFDVHSIEEDIDFDALFQQNETIGFCYPIYGSAVPKIMRDFVGKHKTVLADKKIIIFCTQLMFSGDGAYAFEALLSDIPHEVVYAEHFNMPNNICNISVFPVKNGSQNDKKIGKAEAKLRRVCKELGAGKIRLRGFNVFSRLLGLMQRPGFLKMEPAAADKVIVDHDACILCGKCVQECPTCNFVIEDEKVLPLHNCTICYRCVNLCPKQAIRVWIDKNVRTQYKGIEQ